MADAAREERTLRERGAAAGSEADRLDEARAPLPGPMLVQTKSLGSYPTSAARFYACDVLGLDGTEGENNAVTFDTPPGTVYVANAGTAVPPSGTKMMAYPIAGRNVMIFNG